MIIRWGVVVLVAIAAVVSSATAQQYFNYSGGSGVIGYTKAIDLNAVGETAVPLSSSRYVLRGGGFTNCTEVDNLAVIVGTVRTAAAGGGLLLGNITIQDSTNPPNHPELLHQGAASPSHPEGLDTVLTASTLYVRVTTPRGAAMACDFYVIGDTLP